MSTAQQHYATNIRCLPPTERMELAALILNDLTQEKSAPRPSTFALDLLETLPGGRLFKTAEEADEYLRQERESWER